MIIRDGAGIHTLICDNCYEEVEMSSFEECVAYTKAQRWGLAKEDGDWRNYCRDCKDKRQLWDEFSIKYRGGR